MQTWIVIITVAVAVLGPLLAFAIAGLSAMTRGLPRWYLRPFGFERWRSGRCYRWLGVRQFKYWLPWSGDWIVRRTGKHPLRQRNHQTMLDKAFQDTVLCEQIHVFIFVPLLPTIIKPFRRRAGAAGLFVVAVNVFGNLYSIMVQRYYRARLLPSFLIASGNLGGVMRIPKRLSLKRTQYGRLV